MTLESQRKICKRIQREQSIHIQRKYLASVLDNRMALILGHSSYTAPDTWHIQFFENPSHAYCGAPLNGGKRKHVRYNETATTALLCQRCTHTLVQLANEEKPWHSD